MPFSIQLALYSEQILNPYIFLSFISLTQFNSQSCDRTHLCWTVLQRFKKMYVRFIITVYKHWVILITFGNNTLLKISFLIIPLFMFTRLDTLKKLPFERIWILLKFLTKTKTSQDSKTN